MSETHSYEAVNDITRTFVGWGPSVAESLRAVADQLEAAGFDDYPLTALSYAEFDGHIVTAVVSE